MRQLRLGEVRQLAQEHTARRQFDSRGCSLSRSSVPPPSQRGLSLRLPLKSFVAPQLCHPSAVVATKRMFTGCPAFFVSPCPALRDMASSRFPSFDMLLLCSVCWASNQLSAGYGIYPLVRRQVSNSWLDFYIQLQSGLTGDLTQP